MENCSDTQIEEKRVAKKRMTIVYALLGLVAAPIVFLFGLPAVSYYVPWLASDRKINMLQIWLTFFGAIAIGVA
jgi:hypothetical protein